MLLGFWLLTLVTLGHCYVSYCPEGEDAVSVETRRAATVLTGKVQQIEKASDGGKVAVITVKRVLKKPRGNEPKAGTTVRVRLEPDRKGPCIPKDDAYAEGVVSGRGGGDGFTSHLKAKDTRIFLLDTKGRLQVPPLALRLDLLTRVSHSVKDITYKPRPPIIEEPCEKTFCAYGASCVQTPEGRAECQCPAECPTVYTPVCGTDGVTYTNHCMMRMKACHQEQNTRVLHAGECDSRQRNPKRHHHGRKES